MARMARRDAILDSSILIQHARTRDKGRSHFARSLSTFNSCLSVITVYELELGAYRAGRSSDLDTLRIAFSILPVTEEIAKRTAALDAALIRPNIQIGIKDTFIAATCLVQNLPLITINMKHFNRIEGLDLIDLDSLPTLD